jgi:hypothetical protein
MITRLYGNLTAEAVALDITARLGSGDLHSVVWDHKDEYSLFANARKSNFTGGQPKACHRQFTRVNLTQFFTDSI